MESFWSDSSGNFIRGIGQGMFAFPHGLFVDRDDNLWVADDGVQNGKGNQVVDFQSRWQDSGDAWQERGDGWVAGQFHRALFSAGHSRWRHFCHGWARHLATGGGVSLGFDAKRSDPAHMGIVKLFKRREVHQTVGSLREGTWRIRCPACVGDGLSWTNLCCGPRQQPHSDF